MGQARFDGGNMRRYTLIKGIRKTNRLDCIVRHDFPGCLNSSIVERSVSEAQVILGFVKRGIMYRIGKVDLYETPVSSKQSIV